MYPLFILYFLVFTPAHVKGAAVDKGQQFSGEVKHSHLSPLSAIALEAEQSGLSGNFEQASRLISDLEQELSRFLSSESSLLEPNSNADTSGSYAHASQYSAEQLPEVEFERQNNQVQSLIEQVRTLGTNMEGTIRDLNSNGRLVTAAIMKSMLNNVRRVETNLERFQTRVQTLQGTARPAGASASASSASQSATLSANVNQVLTPIRDRFNKLNDEITQLMNRIRPSGSSNAAASNASAAVQPAVTSVLRPVSG